MPDNTLSAVIAEAYASAPVSEVVLHTLEFRHASFTQPIRVVRDYNDLSAYLEASAPVNPGAQVNFIAFAFDFKLPDVGTSTLPEIEIELDNVSGEIVSALDQAANSGSLIEVTYRPYLLSDLSGPSMNPPLTLVVREVKATVFRITARCGFGNLATLQFPNEKYTSLRFPGLTGGS